MKNLATCFVCICSFLLGEMTSFEKGIKSYNTRAEYAVGLKAQAGPINYAIKEFIEVQNNPEEELESGIYLLRCYYYKGKFVAESDEQKKAVFNEGKALGERLLESYAESAPARYWYLVNLGSWAEVYGILSAAKEGVADLMRDHSNKIIQLDPEYSNGGGYFMLGAVHFKSPYIPFILSWPRNDKAIEYLTKAFESGRPTPSQTVYLARAVYKDGQKDRAKNLLTALLEQPFSENEPVEDFEQHQEAKTLLEDWK